MSKRAKKIVPTGQTKKAPDKKGEMTDDQAGEAAGGILISGTTWNLADGSVWQTSLWQNTTWVIK